VGKNAWKIQIYLDQIWIRFNYIVMMGGLLHFHALQGVIPNQVDSTDLERPVFLELAGSGICSVSVIGLGGIFTNDADHKSTRPCARKVAKVWPHRVANRRQERTKFRPSACRSEADTASR
jgi:hypothetical protein